MENIERILWLNKIENLRGEAQENGLADLAFILWTLYAAVEQGFLPELKEHYSQFVDARIEQLESEIEQKKQQLKQDEIDEYLYDDEQDQHNPFLDGEKEDNTI